MGTTLGCGDGCCKAVRSELLRAKVTFGDKVLPCSCGNPSGRARTDGRKLELLSELLRGGEKREKKGEKALCGVAELSLPGPCAQRSCRQVTVMEQIDMKPLSSSCLTQGQKGFLKTKIKGKFSLHPSTQFGWQIK